MKILRIAAGIFFLATFVALLLEPQEFVLPWIVWFIAAAVLAEFGVGFEEHALEVVIPAVVRQIQGER
ncbi:MAG: hypothetical protein IH787_03965 [Nitrospirae bacterium]|nr:hypothetical protein [Nitrospirota bacterium]